MDRPSSPAERQLVVTHRQVLGIALPMMVAYLTTPLIGVVDTTVVGQFGNAALIGGLAAGAIVFDLVFATFNFLRSGTTGLVAQAMGRGDALEEQAVFWRALVLAVVAGIVLALLAPLFIRAGIWFLDAEPAVNEAMATYIGIRILAAPFALANYAILGYVLGRGEAGLGLGLQVVLNGTNVVLSIVFGLELGWGLAGVAWGTVCGEVIAAVVGMAILYPRFRKGPRLSLQRIGELEAIRRMLALNRDIMIRSFALLAAFAFFARQGAQFGTVTLAANAVLMNFFLVGGYFLDGFATAAEQLAGRAIGGRDRTAFSRAVFLATGWGFGFAIVTTLVFLLFGDAFIAQVTTAADVRAEAAAYLPWAAFTAVSGVLAFSMDGVFIGATWSRDMRNMMVLSLALFWAALVVLSGSFGNHGLWAALHLFLLVRGFSLLSILPARTRGSFSILA